LKRIELIEQTQIKSDIPDFGVGDTIKVHYKVFEGGKERIQIYQGIVIKKQGGGAKSTFTVRKTSFGVGVEKIFPLHSPRIAKIDIISKGKTRRAKLYYLRERIGKKARVKEKRQ